MKKSPLSTPSGSRGKESYNQRLYDHKNKTGYNSVKNNTSLCISPNGVQADCGNDFLPLNVSTPVPEQRRLSGNSHGSGGNRNYRNSGSGGFNHYRNNYHATPKSNFNNSYSPYKQCKGQRKRYQRNAQKHIDISCYIDMKSFLEDPWAELTKKLNQSADANIGKSPDCEPFLSAQSVYVTSETDFENRSVVNADDSCLSQESRNESSLNVTLGLDDTDVSSVSQTKSSIDLKLDDMRFSQGSNDDSICANDNATCQDVRKENNVSHSCDSQTNTIQVV